MDGINICQHNLNSATRAPFLGILTAVPGVASPERLRLNTASRGPVVRHHHPGPWWRWKTPSVTVSSATRLEHRADRGNLSSTARNQPLLVFLSRHQAKCTLRNDAGRSNDPCNNSSLGSGWPQTPRFDWSVYPSARRILEKPNCYFLLGQNRDKIVKIFLPLCQSRKNFFHRLKKKWERKKSVHTKRKHSVPIILGRGSVYVRQGSNDEMAVFWCSEDKKNKQTKLLAGRGLMAWALRFAVDVERYTYTQSLVSKLRCNRASKLFRPQLEFHTDIVEPAWSVFTGCLCSFCAGCASAIFFTFHCQNFYIF